MQFHPKVVSFPNMQNSVKSMFNQMDGKMRCFFINLKLSDILIDIILLQMQNQADARSQSSSEHEPIKHARLSKIRFLLLFLLILVNFANQYAFNNPQAIEDSMETILGINQEQFQLFYSLYALPNIVTLFFIGHMCDKLGVRLGLMFMAGGVCVLQLVIAIGGYIKSYPMILVGRIIFGIFSQALFVPHASMISIWFQGTEQAFALGVGITFPELGNALNSFLTPLIFDNTQNLGDPLLFSFFLNLVGFGIACVCAYIDKRADRIDEENNVHMVLHEGEQEQIRLSDIKKLRREYWITAILCTAAMTCWIPFLDNVNRMFQYRFCYTQVSAGAAISIAYLCAVILSIPLGILVDTFGKRRWLSVASLGVFFIAQFIMLVYPQCDQTQSTGVIVALVFQGIGYAFYGNVLVAMIPLVCKVTQLGTGFGVMQVFESFFEFLVPIITGLMVSSSETEQIGYRYSSVLFTCISIVGLLVSVALFFAIKDHYKKKLDRSSAENILYVARYKQTPHLASSWSNTQDELTARKTLSALELGQDKEGITKPLLALQIEQ